MTAKRAVISRMSSGTKKVTYSIPKKTRTGRHFCKIEKSGQTSVLALEFVVIFVGQTDGNS